MRIIFGRHFPTFTETKIEETIFVVIETKKLNLITSLFELGDTAKVSTKL